MAPCFAFDLDGTLISCRERQVAVMEHVLNELLPLDPFDSGMFWTLKRRGCNNVEALGSLGFSTENAKRAAAAWFQEIEDPRWLRLDPTFPDTIPVLSNLVSGGYRTALLSVRRNRVDALAQVRDLRLLDLLDETVFVPPATGLDDKAAALRGMQPIGYIGDSELDAQAARLAGIPFAAVSEGQRCEDYLRGAGVASVFTTLSDAVTALLDGK